jgi:tellurite resistance protein
VIKLHTETLHAMRDRLRDRGAPASVARPGASLEDIESQALLEDYGPLCEAMFLMMMADGDVGPEERDVLRGALRELDDRIRTAHIEQMISLAEQELAASSSDARLRVVATRLGEDPVWAEVGFVLAAAIAFADDRIVPDENTLLNDLAEALGIDDARSEALMRSLIR